jgi:putative ABC transport system permease protein
MPDWKHEIRRRLAGVKLEPTRETAVVEELAQYLEDCYAEWLACGATEAEAYPRTLAELSGSESLARELRRAERLVEPIILGTNRRKNMIAALWQDLRYGARMLFKNPAFTLIAVITLALGIGANTALFSVVNAVLLRPLPYREPDRLVIFWEQAGAMRASLAYLNFVDLRARNNVFEKGAAYRRDSFNLTGAGAAERLSGRMVTAEFFAVFGKTPARGRDFTAADDAPDAAPTAILSNAYWQRRFGGDEKLIGSQITLNNRSFTVIGVAAADFQFGSGADVFVPLGLYADRYKERGEHPGIFAVGRLKPDVSVAQARADLDAIMAAIGAQFPDSNKDRHTYMELLYDNTVQEVRPTLYILLGAVGFVLLIACANVANLSLSKAAARRKELALRSALGAARWRIARQMLTEGVLLSVSGGALGALLAVWGTGALIAFVPEGIPRLAEAGVDWRVLGFTLALSVLTGLFFGLAPAWQAARLDLNEILKEGGRGSAGARARARRLLVVAEIALALVLLVGAGLMIRSFRSLQQVETGFTANQLLTMNLALTVAPEEAGKARVFLDQLEDRLRRLPGVQAAAISNGMPFAGAVEDSFFLAGDDTTDPRAEKIAVVYLTSPDYLQTMGIQLLRGRYFTPQDRADSAPVAVIDETLARKHFPHTDPLGQRLTDLDVEPAEIVGVVGHVKHAGLAGEAPVENQIYLPLAQIPPQKLPRVAGRLNLLVRTTGDPLGLVAAVRGQAQALNANQPVYNARTMEQIVAGSIAGDRFSLALFALFAGLALALAAVGVYGVMSNTVGQRTHEIGVRLALGAPPRRVLRLILIQGLRLTLIGVGAGLLVSFALTRVMQRLLFGVSATDPLTFAGVSLLLTLTALLACWIPARRATKVDPLIALRSE